MLQEVNYESVKSFNNNSISACEANLEKAVLFLFKLC